MKFIPRSQFTPAAMTAIIGSLLSAAMATVSAHSSAPAGVEVRRNLRRLCCCVSAMLVLLAPALCSPVLSTSFRGVVTTLSTGSVTLSNPSAVVVDSQGDVFIADTGNNQIVEISAAGVASVLTFTGLDPALSSPSGIALDGSGNIYVADSGNNRIVEISAGVGSVVAPNGLTFNSPRGVAVDAAGNLYFTDEGNNRVIKVPAGGSAAALAITSLGTALNSPIGLATDSGGNLYIADGGNNRVVEVAPSGAGTVLSIVGGLTLNTPSGVAVDGVGDVFIADTSNNRTVEVAPGGNPTVLFTGSLTLNHPLGVAVDVAGSAYIADSSDNVIDHASMSAVGFGHVQYGAASGTTETLNFTVGYGVTLGSVQALTLGTPGLDFIAALSPSCDLAGPKGCGGGTTCVNGATNRSCRVIVTFLPTAPGLRRGAIVLFNNSVPPVPIITVPLYGFGDAPLTSLAPNIGTVINAGGLALSYPFQVALDGAGNIYVGDYIGSDVTRIPAGGGNATRVTLGTPGGIAVQYITGVAIDGAGNLFVGDHENNRILVVTPGGIVSVLSITGSPALGLPTALAFDAAGNLCIADYANGRIIRVSTPVVAGSTSSGLGVVIGTGTFSFTGSTLTGITADAQGNIYAAAGTENSSSIIKVTTTGVASALSFPGITPAISNPQGVAVDAMGNIYVVDSGNSRIVALTTAGVASVLSISGLPAPSTLSSTLFGVTLDPSGNLYIPDWTNNRIVFVNISEAALAFASTNQGSTSTDSPKTATVANLGNQALVFATDPTFTANFSQPSASSNQCLVDTSLTSGTVCNVSVQFTPQSVGSLSAGIVLTNNTVNVGGSTQTISVSGIGLNPGDTTAVSVSSSATSAGIGQPLTVTALVTDTTSGHTATVPTGGVTFVDTVGSTATSLNGGGSVALVGGTAVLARVQLSGAGLHTITADYAGVAGSFLAASNTSTLTVSKDTEIIAGPTTQPVQVVTGQAGSVRVTVTGPYSGEVASPSGTLGYSVLNSSNVRVASGSAALTPGETSSTGTVSLANSLAAGTYTVSVSYGGDGNYAASAAATTIQLVVGQITPTVNWTEPAGITYGSTLGGVLTASAANGSTPVPGTFSYTATLQGGSAISVTGATRLSAGTYALTAAFTPTDIVTYKAATSSVSLAVAQVSPAIALASSATTVLSKSTVTFTATVSSSAGAPAGSVTFYDGTTSLGSGTLSQGVASYTTSNLTTGAHSVTAHYGGSADFAALTSSALTETVDDFSLNIAPSGTSSATVTPGGTATYALVIGPTTGTTFPGALNLSVTGLPSGAIATLTPNTLNAGAGSTDVSLTVHVPTQTASLHHNHQVLALQLCPLLGMLLLPFSGTIRRSVQKHGALALLLTLSLLGTSALTGCGTKNTGFLGNPQRSYTLTLTATSGSLSHSTTLKLTVQ